MHREGSPGHLLNLLGRIEISETLKDAAADNGDCGKGSHAVNTPRELCHTVMLHCSYLAFKKKQVYFASCCEVLISFM